MAEEETNEEELEGAESEETPAKGKGSVKLLGAVVALIGTGTALALMAVPKKVETPVLTGPAMYQFFESDLVGNPLDDNYARYLKFSPKCSYFAYDPNYPTLRREDTHYDTLLREIMQFTVSQYRIEEVMAGTKREVFAAALEEVAEPILFPVHLGPTKTPYDIDEASGLRLGDSQERAGSFRGLFHEHTLKVDGERKKLQLDAGPEVTFKGDEFDLLVENAKGGTLYVDVTGLKEGFFGEVNVGVMGRIRRLFTGDIIAQ